MPIAIHTCWRHWKGTLYEVFGIARHSETHEELILYYKADEPFGQVWARPVSSFLGMAERDGEIVPRFKRID